MNRIKFFWEMWKLYGKKEQMLAKLGSRKLWATLAGVFLVTLFGQLGVGGELAQQVITLVQTYIAGQAAVDVAAAIRK